MKNLNHIYQGLLDGKVSVEDAREIIASSDVQKSINALINKNSINKLIPYSEEDLQFIQMVINITQFIYNYSGESTGISDPTYDMLYSIMVGNGGADIVSVPIAPSMKNIAYHKYPNLRGTLPKLFYLTNDEKRINPSRRYLDEWKQSMENKIFEKIGQRVDLDDYEIYVFPKWDGVSGVFELNEFNELQRVLTRGYTETNEAQDITSKFISWFVRKYPERLKVPYGLKTEIMMTEDNLKYYNEKYHADYRNSRSIVSGILNDDNYDPDKIDLLHIVPLRIGFEDGSQEIAAEAFRDYPYIRCRLKDREVIREFAYNHKYVNGLRCDGAVIHIIDPKIQSILGRENDMNLYEVAYKFTGEDVMSTLIGIEFQMGLFGRLAPVAKVKPVKLKGNTIENISLGSMGRFKELKLHKGDEVKVLYDIIPYLTVDDDCSKIHTGDLIEAPKRCPECGSKLQESDSGDIIYCNNPKCPCRMKGKILNYLDKMNIDNLSYGTIDKLFEKNIVRCIEDLYSLKKNKYEILSIEGCGVNKLQLWIDSINSRKTVFDYEVLGALGIEGVSKKMFNKILQVYTMDELLEIAKYGNIGKIICIAGFKDKTAGKVIDGINQDRDLIKFLMNTLNIMDTKGKKKAFSVCFTKIRDNDLEKFILGVGGEVADSVTKDTTFVVVPTLDTKSSKADKARKYGIPIIPIDDVESTISNMMKLS